MYKASETLTGVADVNTGLKFLDKETVEPYIDDEVPLRGQLQDRRRHAVVAVAVETGSDAASHRGRQRAPAGSRGAARGSSALGLGRRLLTLREGSVIVITIVVAAYFAVTTDAFLTWENFKTLLPYFAPFAILAAGEVFLMINGEIDLSIGAVYLFAPFLFYEIDNWRPAADAGLVAARWSRAWSWARSTASSPRSSASTRSSPRSACCSALEGFTLIISDAQPVATPGHVGHRRDERRSRTSSAAAPTPS